VSERASEGGPVDAAYREILRHSAGPRVAHPATPEPAVACFLWRPGRGGEIEVYLVRRAPNLAFLGGYWSVPGGRVEPRDRDHRAAAAREVAEGTGVSLVADARTMIPAGVWVTPALSPIRFEACYYLVELPPGAEPDALRSGGELTEGAWVSPAEALERRRRGEWLVPAPIATVLEALAGGIEGASERITAAAAREEGAPRLWQLAGGLWLCPVRTPTLPPATHTNCAIVGDRELVVIDPASPYAEEQAELDRALDHLCGDGARVVEIWLTHHHLDHVSGAAHLARRLGVPVAAHRLTAERLERVVAVDRHLVHGDARELAGDPARRLRAVFTPGHAPGHLCFLEERTGIVIAGDMIAGLGTILIDPDEGDMTEYLESLRRLKALEPRALLPAHGGVIADPAARLDAYVQHRLWREERVLAALSARGPSAAAELVPAAYADVPAALHLLAERSLTAHLIKLAADGRARRAGDARWEPVR
jgi:endoribonuclease LACTB2